jgi:hypothetical protein
VTDGCAHANLVLLRPEAQTRLRCRHCHLTIDEGELGGGPCPECREARGVTRSDFERVEVTTRGETEVRCEDCGLRVE